MSVWNEQKPVALKQNILLVLLLFIVQINLQSQGCLTDGITFSNQQEIDDFPSIHPTCTEIDGFVIINGDDIYNLDSLSGLLKIHGNLTIGGESNSNPLLDSLNGLSGIEWIGGNLAILNNDSAIFSNLLPNLDSIGGNLTVNENDWLPTIVGLNDLIWIGGDLNINNNHRLSYFDFLQNLNYIGGSFNLGIFMSGSEWYPVDFSGMESLDSIAGNFNMTGAYKIGSFGGLDNLSYIGGDFIVTNDFNLTSFDGLDNLNFIGGNLYISDNYNLSSISGLATITSLDSGLYIIHNVNLPLLDGLSNLTHVGSDIEIRNNDFLSAISEFSLLDSVHDLNISNNIILQSISGFESIEYVGGNFSIRDNPVLPDLSAFEQLSKVNGSVIITHNDLFINLNQLSNLGEINGSLRLEYNDELIDLEGLEGIDSIGGSLHISRNTQLEDLNGLINLTSINDSLYINWNDSLHDLQGLNYLEEVGGKFIVSWHFHMPTLDGLDSLTSIGDVLKLEFNTQLTDITSLENLQLDDMSIIGFEGNYFLSECAIQSICDYLVDPPPTTNYYFFDNAEGCNSDADVEEACLELDINLIFSSQEEIDNFPSNCTTCDVINGNVIIEGDDISNLDGLSVIEEIQGNLMIGGNMGNPNLLNLSGMDNLSIIGGSFTIENNASLTSINGIVADENQSALNMSSLEEVGGSLVIINNESLVDLVGLELNSINGDLIIEGNESLGSLEGLDGLDSESIMNLYISNNPMLSLCQVISVCAYIADPTGVIEIDANDEGCNSEEEIHTQCTIGIEESNSNEKISIYPNPARDLLFVSSLDNSILKELFIFDQVGKIVLQTSNSFELIDVSLLSSGVYFIELHSDRSVSRKKLVIE